MRAFSADNPLTYTGTNAAEFLSAAGKLGWVLDSDYPGQAHAAFSIREANTTGPVHKIEEGDTVWPGALGLTVDKAVSTNRKVRATRLRNEPSMEDRVSAIQRILKGGSDTGRHARAQLIADLNAIGVDDDEITAALKAAWLTYGES